VLVIEAGALAATWTTRATAAVSPGRSGNVRVHVTVEPALLQLNPPPLPLTYVRPVGRWSVMVIVPVVVDVPTLRTVSV
jgi:hypothetical protein